MMQKMPVVNVIYLYFIYIFNLFLSCAFTDAIISVIREVEEADHEKNPDDNQHLEHYIH